MARKTACLPKGTRISDYVTLGVLTTTVPGELIDAVLSDTGKQSRRYRQLPARLVVYYVMALVLFAPASYGEVLRCLLEGVRWLHLKGESTALAGKSAITKARIRLGIAPMRELFERVARPLAEPGLPGAWYRGRRLVSLDGTTILVPDAPELEQRFGRPSSSRGPGAFPHARPDGKRHACDLRRRDRPLRHQRGRAGSSAAGAAAPRHAVPGRPRLRRLRPVAGGAGPGRRPAVAGKIQSEVPVPQAPGRRIVPEPPAPLIRSPQTGARGRRAGHRVPPGRCPRRRAAVPPDHLPDRPGKRAGRGTGRLVPQALGTGGRLRRAQGHAARRAAHAPLAPRRPGRTGTLRPAARPPRAAWADGPGQPPGRVRSGHAVVHPHGAGGPAPSSLPRRLFPLASAGAWLSGS